MKHTLILYENEEIDYNMMELIKKVLGPASFCQYSDFDGDFSDCLAATLLLPEDEVDIGDYITKNPFPFIIKYLKELKTLKVATLSFCNNNNLMEKDRVTKIKSYLRDSLSYCDNISLDEVSNKEIISNKLLFLKRYLLDSSDMPRNLLTKEIRTLLQSHNTCTLCTGYNNHIRATPIEYTYQNEALYFLSEGGEKFAYLHTNNRVAVCIYTEYTDFSHLEGVQIEGITYPVTLHSDEYNEIVRRRGLLPDNLKNLPVQLNMFRVIPERIQVLKSEFKANSYNARQTFVI